jgi:hypothetical protein
MIKYIGMDEEEQRNLDRWRNMHDLHRLSDGELVFNPCWVWTEVNIAGDVTSSKPDKSALWPMSVDVIHVLEAIDGFKTVRMCYSVTLGLFIAYQLCVKSTHAICRQNAGVDADSQNVIPHFDLPPRHYCSRLCPTNSPPVQTESVSYRNHKRQRGQQILGNALRNTSDQGWRPKDPFLPFDDLQLNLTDWLCHPNHTRLNRHNTRP